MAGFHIHIAIGKEYLKKNEIININEFYKGIIDPDLGCKKDTHYSGYQDKNNLKEYLANKVDLKKYVMVNEINTDYQKGMFLHLLTDYLFFNYFFSNDYIDNVSYDKFCQDLYFSYSLNNKYIENKYKLSDFPYWDIVNKDIVKKTKIVNIKLDNNILDNDKVDIFIKNVANINLEEYRNKILTNVENT